MKVVVSDPRNCPTCGQPLEPLPPGLRPLTPPPGVWEYCPPCRTIVGTMTIYAPPMVDYVTIDLDTAKQFTAGGDGARGGRGLMHYTYVTMKDGTEHCGTLWAWRPQAGWFSLVGVSERIQLRDVQSAVQREQRTTAHGDPEDVDLLERARREGWDGH